MQVIRPREELAGELYLSKADIARLLKVPRSAATRIYDYANEIDSQMRFRIFPNRVKITSVCKVTGFTLETIRRQALKKMDV